MKVACLLMLGKEGAKNAKAAAFIPFVFVRKSVIYPYLILRTRNGYIYNYMIQLGLYNIARCSQ
jgi:hypothetical protein